MGLVGVNGKITLPRSLDKACLLYMTVEGNVTTYNNGFCLFPIVAAAVTAVFALVFLIFLAMVLRRKDDVAPKPISMALVVWSFLLALLAFAVCGEIGLGLNKGCRILGDKSAYCLSTKQFNGKPFFLSLSSSFTAVLLLFISFIHVQPSIPLLTNSSAVIFLRHV